MEATLGVDSDWESSDEKEAATPQAVTALAVTGANSDQNAESHLSDKDLKDIALYEGALKANIAAQHEYEEFEIVLYRALRIIREKLKATREALMLKKKIQGGNTGFSYLRCGKPYFKDINDLVPPDNADTIMLKQAGMYDFSQVSAVLNWTPNDKIQLVNALLEQSRNIKEKEIKTKLAALYKEGNDSNLKQIAFIEKQLSQLHKKTLMQIALPLNQDYDWEALAKSLNRRHTAQEYKGLWKTLLHPAIKKTCWDQAEHAKLKMLAEQFKMQDWDTIAKNLNTGRTGYQCFVYHRTYISNTPNRKWTREEEKHLQNVIDYFGKGTYIPWSKVANSMNNRTKIQVYNKYTRMNASRKGRFLKEEDIVIVEFHDKYGDNFRKMARFLPGRSPDQLGARFNLLTKLRLSKTWTVEDDRKLLQIMDNSDSSTSFSTATTHFPGKDRMHLRSRYLTLRKWMKKYPAADISKAPRRGPRKLVQGQAAGMDFKQAVMNLQKRIRTEK